jgi:hypothetical protein
MGALETYSKGKLLNVVHESCISVACIGFDFAFLLASNFVCSMLLIDRVMGIPDTSYRSH